jgi:ketosteroid isomerase-like protein
MKHTLRMLLWSIAFVTGSSSIARGLPVVSSPLQCEPGSGLDSSTLSAILSRQARAWEKHDFRIAALDWLPDGELTSPGGRVKVGEMASVIDDYAKHFRDLKVIVKSTFVSSDGKQAAIEWDWDVTRIRDGKHGITHDAILVTFEGDKIKSWREYFDLGDSVDAQP